MPGRLGSSGDALNVSTRRQLTKIKVRIRNQKQGFLQLGGNSGSGFWYSRSSRIEWLSFDLIKCQLYEGTVCVKCCGGKRTKVSFQLKRPKMLSFCAYTLLLRIACLHWIPGTLAYVANETRTIYTNEKKYTYTHIHLLIRMWVGALTLEAPNPRLTTVFARYYLRDVNLS